ncbi:hypothetical protein M2318_003969 [Metapseudomonas resinovorans]
MTRLIETLQTLWNGLPDAVGHYAEGAYELLPEVRRDLH